MSNRYDRRKEDSALTKLAGFLAPDKKKIVATVVLGILGVVLLLLAPLALKELSSLLLEGQTGTFHGVQLNKDLYFKYVFILAGIALGLYLFSKVFTYLGMFITVGVCSRSSERLRNAMIGKINTLPLNYFDTRNIGDVLSYVNNDVDVIGNTLNIVLSQGISAIITLLGTVVILFIMNWMIALIVLVLLPLGLLVLKKIGVASEVHFVARQNLTSQISALAEESFTGSAIIKAYRAKDTVNDKFAVTNFELEKSNDKSDFYGAMMIPVMLFFGNLMVAIVALVGGLIAFWAKGTDPDIAKTAIPVIVASITYANNLLQPLSTLANVFASLQQTKAAASRVFAFLAEVDEPDESMKTGKIENIKGNIEFDHVKFGYTKNRIIVHDFSEKAISGQKIAIVGPTGAGKTTMINLIMRFYETNAGSIRIDGVDTKTLNRSYVRGLFGMVLQDTWLFEGTIMENLKYSRPEATDEEVIAACKATRCDTFIRQQPGGYNHVLNEDCGLSSGQKQLLTIARAMVQNAPMLILDEATSSVDTRTELLIQEAMDALMKGRTSFVIAHRLSTIKNSNLIIVMKDGDVIETGNHDQLMEKDGFYAALYNSQFTGKGPQFS